MYQSHKEECKDITHRKKTLVEKHPLITTNSRYYSPIPHTDSSDKIEAYDHRNHSAEREERIRELYSQAQKQIAGGLVDRAALTKSALSLEGVSNKFSVYSWFAFYKDNNVDLSVELGNSYTGRSLRKVPLEQIIQPNPIK
jgi:hypothetical protein